MTFTSLSVLVSRPYTIIIEGREMAVKIKFDYYHLKIDKKRARMSDQGQNFFGNIPLDDLFKKLANYSTSHSHEFSGNGKQIVSLKSGKKWFKWVSVEYDSKEKVYKLLLTYNDVEVDPRILEDGEDNVLTQEIPDQHGQRTLLHIVVKPNSKLNEANICIQNILGLNKDFLLRLFKELIILAYPDQDDWVEVDSMTNKDIKTKPEIELLSVTDNQIIDAINEGLLRDVFFTERSDSPSKFDMSHYLTEEKMNLSIKVEKEDPFFKKAKEKDLFEWIKSVRKSKKSRFKGEPQTFLIVQDPQTKSDVKHEFLEDSITGFKKKAYLNWEDREVDTHKLLKSEDPKPIPQFFLTMIKNLK